MTASPVVSITDELIAELEAAAVMATPGPWLIEQTTVYSLNNERILCNRFSARVDSGWADDYQRISLDEAQANARHMANCCPDTIKALLAERADLKQQLAAASVDAARWRYARQILTIEAIETAQSDFINFGLPAGEPESIRADEAIDAASDIAAMDIGSGD